jgi:hypothetical protein
MSTPLNFLQASVRADELVANQNIGIGTNSQASELHIKASAPEIRLEDRVGAEASETATRIYADSGNTYIQSGVNFTDGSSSNIVFGSMGNTTEFVNIGAHGIETTGNLFVNNLEFTQTQGLDQILNVSNTTSNIMTLTNTSDDALNVAGGITLGSNLAVNTDDLFVDTQAGRVGIGSTQPTESLDIVGNLNLQKVSNTATIKLNSNVVTEYTRSKKSLIKYPRVAMTANSSGGYVASSSTSNQPPYKAFDNILFSSYFEPVFNTNPYPNADGAYTGGTGTVYSTNGYQGDYLQIQLPETIKLYSYSISNRKGSSVAGRQPKDAKIFASNDGSTWVDIHTHFDGGETYDVTDGETRSFNLSNVPETYYKYYRLVVNSIIEGGSSDTPNISDWSLFGTPEYDPEAHGTDVIMRSVPNVPNTDWLEVYWDAGNTSSYSGSGTTVNDLSGNGVTGTITGTNGFDSTYKAFTFDGSGDYIQGTTSIGTGAVIHTWSLWVKNLTPTSTQYAYICGFGTAGSATMSGFMLRNGDRLEFTAYGTYVYYEDFPNTANTWKHVVGVYRGGAWNSANCDIYIDGRKVSVVGTSTTTLNISGTTVNIGSNPGGGQPFVGSIANFRLFNRSLSADEVWQLYAYQKEYFDVSPDVVTFKGGRLGIGTSEPRAVLDVRGSIQANGRPVWPVPTAHFYKASPGSANQTYYEDIVITGRVDLDSTYFESPGVIERYVYSNSSNKTTENSSSGGIIKFCLPGTYYVSSKICINKQSEHNKAFEWRFYHLTALGGNFRVGSVTDGTASYGGEYPDTGVVAPTGYGRVWMVRVTEAPAYGYSWFQPSANSGTYFRFETYGGIPMAHIDIFYLG